MEILKKIRERFAGDTSKHPCLALYDDGAAAKADRRGCDLKSDIPAADEGNPFAVLHDGLQGVGIRDRAQFVDTLQINAGQRDPSRPGTGRKHKHAVGQR